MQPHAAERMTVRRLERQKDCNSRATSHREAAGVDLNSRAWTTGQPSIFGRRQLGWLGLTSAPPRTCSWSRNHLMPEGDAGSRCLTLEGLAICSPTGKRNEISRGCEILRISSDARQRGLSRFVSTPERRTRRGRSPFDGRQKGGIRERFQRERAARLGTTRPPVGSVLDAKRCVNEFER